MEVGSRGEFACGASLQIRASNGVKMKYYITDTYDEAMIHEGLDCKDFQDALGEQESKYWEVTTYWSLPAEGLDGKWIRAYCYHSTRSSERVIETDPYDGSWFLINEG